jgi:hypothetical protein
MNNTFKILGYSFWIIGWFILYLWLPLFVEIGLMSLFVGYTLISNLKELNGGKE